MDRTVPISVIIPTYSRGMSILTVLEKIQLCDLKPKEILIHIDLGDGILERELKRRFPKAGIMTSSIRLGPGGGRHRCLLKCNTPYAVSFDDDSYPVDSDFFSRVERLFAKYPQAAVFGANIWHRQESEKTRSEKVVNFPSYMGCGYALRLAAYRQVRGYLPRPVSYGMEETDLSLQLFAAGWQVYEAGELRVFHDTDLKHHQSREVTAGSIANVALYAFLNYPLAGLSLGLAQVANRVVYCIRMGRLRGIIAGLLRIPIDCYHYRWYRKPVAWQTVKAFHYFNRTGSDTAR
jgi:GT2 family glycosyltransferase